MIDPNNWCIKITKENREAVREHLGKGSWNWSLDAYYGKKHGVNEAKRESFTTVITDEQFVSDILKIQKQLPIFN